MDRCLHPDSEIDVRLWLSTELFETGPDGKAWRLWQDPCSSRRDLAVLTPHTTEPTVAVPALGGEPFAVHLCTLQHEDEGNS